MTDAESIPAEAGRKPPTHTVKVSTKGHDLSRWVRVKYLIIELFLSFHSTLQFIGLFIKFLLFLWKRIWTIDHL